MKHAIVPCMAVLLLAAAPGPSAASSAGEIPMHRNRHLLAKTLPRLSRARNLHNEALSELEAGNPERAQALSQLALEIIQTPEETPNGSASRARLRRDLLKTLLYSRNVSELLPASGGTFPTDSFFPGPIRRIKVELNPRVVELMDYFRGPGRVSFSGWLKNAGRYMPLNMRILREHGLPAELAVLPMLESGFSNHARSKRRAVGPWQFVRGTARRFGLTVNRWIDERRDPELSARAAARYLSELYGRFGDWPLALAAYNAGEARVENAIVRGQSRDYWSLDLPRETKRYVPKFMAALIILRAPAQFGFTVPDATPLECDTLITKAPIDLYYLSTECNVSLRLLRELNPALRKTRIPIYKNPLLLRVPKDMRPVFAEAISKRHEHVVRKGETLSQIARRYGTTVRAIAKLNGIKNPRFIRAGRLLSIPALSAVPARKEHEWGQVVQADKTYYIVKPGDSFYGIAHRFGLSVSELMRRNGRSSNSILRIGQKIVLFDEAAGPGGSSAPLKHVVRPGENLWEIARKYNVNVQRIIEANSIRHPGLIHPGNEILIPAGMNSR